MPLEQRILLHNDVLRLRQQGLTYNAIIERIHSLSGVRLSKSHISDWVRGLHTPLGRVNKFDAKPSAELAYIIGMKASDGNIYNNKRNYHFTIELRVIDYEYAELTGRCLTELLRRREPYQPRWDENERCWRVWCRSILLYQFLRQPLDELKPYIEHCKDCVTSFLKAFFDGEGSIAGRHVTVYNTKREVLLYVQQLLHRFVGIEATGPHEGTKPGYRFRSRNGKTYMTYYKTCYYLYIPVRSLPLFYRYVGFTIKRKQLRLMRAMQR